MGDEFIKTTIEKIVRLAAAAKVYSISVVINRVIVAAAAAAAFVVLSKQE